MKLPLSWIQDVIDINIPTHEIAKVLTLAGLEVDSYAPVPLGFEKIVVAEVTDTKPHPDADKLCIANVTTGDQEFQVVCGAPNCRPGLKTAYAMVGSTLKDENSEPYKVKKGKLRGVESMGMLCSEAELGLGNNHDGIIEFAEQISVGADVADIFGDTVFEISLTPNLGHCASVIGVARELAAATEKTVKPPKVNLSEDHKQSLKNQSNIKLSVEVLDKKKCPRYACRLIKDVKVGPSPAWIQKRLIACDMRPVNNIVDITNYVLLEYGHPLHAFDFDRLDGQKIVVRTAKEGERFVTLDDKERTLNPEDLLICDANKPVAIAGVMGGKNSEVSLSTQNILLESAYFLPTAIRRTSKKLGLQTEASRRFERGADPNNVLIPLDRAAMLIAELAGGTVCEGVIDLKEQVFARREIPCRLSRINKLLGTQLGLSEVESIFHRLEMTCSWDGQDTFIVKPPTYRVDVAAEIDLVEEVARIYGFDNIPKPTPRFIASSIPDAPIYLFENFARNAMISEGLQEFLTCDLVGPKLLNIVHEEHQLQESEVKVLNPTSVEQSILRTSLLPGLLQVAKHNYDNECQNLCGFEIGRAHFKKEEKYFEQSLLGIILTGKSRPAHWDQKPLEVDFYDLKGVVENFLDLIGAPKAKFENEKLTSLHNGRQASVILDNIKVGVIGEVHPSIRRRLDMPQRIYFAELDLHELYKFHKKGVQMEELPIYPASDRDLTLTLPEEIPVQKVLDVIHSITSRLLEKVTVKDLFRSEKIGKGKKNVTFHFVYRNNKKTIAQEAVDAEHARITTQAESLLGGKNA